MGTISSILFNLLVLLSSFHLGIDAHSTENHGARCTGSASCRACKNCNYCKHCNSGGSCGVCRGGNSSRSSSYSTYSRNSSSSSRSYSSSTGSSFYSTPSFPEPRNYYVNAKQLNVRSGPSIEYPVIGKLSKGEVHLGTPSTSSWIKIELISISNGELKQKTGYVHKSYLSAL